MSVSSHANSGNVWSERMAFCSRFPDRGEGAEERGLEVGRKLLDVLLIHGEIDKLVVESMMQKVVIKTTESLPASAFANEVIHLLTVFFVPPSRSRRMHSIFRIRTLLVLNLTQARSEVCQHHLDEPAKEGVDSIVCVTFELDSCDKRKHCGVALECIGYAPPRLNQFVEALEGCFGSELGGCNFPAFLRVLNKCCKALEGGAGWWTLGRVSGASPTSTAGTELGALVFIGRLEAAGRAFLREVLGFFDKFLAGTVVAGRFYPFPRRWDWDTWDRYRSFCSDVGRRVVCWMGTRCGRRRHFAL